MSIRRRDPAGWWPGGRIPFIINQSDFPPGSALDVIIQNAITTWNAAASPTLTPRAGEINYVEFKSATDKCASHVGVGGRQIIGCDVDDYGVGHLLHEIGHAAGLHHEQCRADRNDFVNILIDNIRPEWRDQYAQKADGEDMGAYDYDSIMHYPTRSEVGYPGLDQIVVPAGTTVGQRDHLSVGDLTCLELTYRDKPGWHRIEGSLDCIAVGSVNAIWGTNASGQLWRLFDPPPPTGPSWELIPAPGGLIHISAAQDGSVWGIDRNTNIFRWTGVAPAYWDHIPGSLVQVSAGSATNVWGVNADNNIFHLTGGGFTPIGGALRRISAAADGSVWGVNLGRGVFRWDAGSNTFVRVDGVLLTDVSNGGGGNVWGINSAVPPGHPIPPVDGQIVRRTGDDTPWQLIDGQLSQVSVGNDGTVWGVTVSPGAIFRREPYRP